MPFAWTLARFLFKVVAPSVPEIISTVATLKKQQMHNQPVQEASDTRLVELEKTVTTQLLLIEQLTRQLQALQKTVSLALYLAIGGLVISLVVLGVLVFR